MALREVRYRIDARAGASPGHLPLLLARAAPGVTVETTVAHLDDAGDVWRILGVHGSPADVRRAADAFASYRPAFLREKQVLGQSGRRLILWYKYRAGRGSFSHTALALRTLGRDSVITDRTRGTSLAVRILCRSGPAVERFLRQIRGGTPETTVTLQYVGPPQDDPGPDLTQAEESTLRAAWSSGYYAVPRKSGVREVAAKTGLSPSAAGYRLRRAEAKLVGRHLAG